VALALRGSLYWGSYSQPEGPVLVPPHLAVLVAHRHQVLHRHTEDAIQNASRELDLPVEELNIDVIEPGSAGIFGLVGGKKARIK
jgi:hypothetical protein